MVWGTKHVQMAGEGLGLMHVAKQRFPTSCQLIRVAAELKISKSGDPPLLQGRKFLSLEAIAV